MSFFSMLPLDLQREVVRQMDGTEQKEASAAGNSALRQEVMAHYARGNAADRRVLDAFLASQPADAPPPPRAPQQHSATQPVEDEEPFELRRMVSNIETSARPAQDERVQRAVQAQAVGFGAPRMEPFHMEQQTGYLQQRADSLMEKSLRAFGGPRFVESATEETSISHRHPDAQARLAKARWNSKVIGLYPFLKAVEGGERYFEELDPRLPDHEKFKAMLHWLETYKDRAAAVASIHVNGYRSRNIPGVASLFYDLGGKVYNLAPREAAKYFTGLKELSFCNNVLKELPVALGLLPLTKLDLSMNPFEAVPEAVAQMRHLKELSLSACRGSRFALGEDSPLWRAVHLRTLDLSSNGLGTLARNVRGLVRLQTLILNDNQLMRLTSKIRDLQHLETLDLRSNLFTSVPQVLAEIPRLRTVRLEGNPLLEPIELAVLIRLLAERGRDCVEISTNLGFLSKDRIATLQQEVGNTHTVTLVETGFVARIILQKRDFSEQATQPIDYEEME